MAAINAMSKTTTMTTTTGVRSAECEMEINFLVLMFATHIKAK